MQLLMHDVFFALNDASDDACAQLVGSAHQHLAPHAGVVFFAVGTRATAHSRDVNDAEYDVSLHVCFDDAAAHDAYQVTDAHKAFIDENEANWKRVRVFDSLVVRS